MLKLSTKGRYGVRAMFELGRAYGKGPVLMGAIAEQQGLSRKYLHALLTSLKKSGLVKSVRGARGGYMLTKPPGEIPLNEVVESLEGPLSIVHCVRDEKRCSRSAGCAVQPLWRTLNKALDQILGQLTLADLIDESSSLTDARFHVELRQTHQGPSV